MPINIIHAAQRVDSPYSGNLKVNVTSSVGMIPIRDATVKISYKGMPDSIIETLDTDISGQTEEIGLPAPPPEYSQEPGSDQPYSEYNIEVNAQGYEPVMLLFEKLFDGKEPEKEFAYTEIVIKTRYNIERV